MAKRRRKPKIYICTLLSKDDVYIELLAYNIYMALEVAKLEYLEDVRYVYKAGHTTANNLNKVKTINCADYLAASLSSVKGDQNENQYG